MSGDLSVTRVGEHVERRERGAIVHFRCTVCNLHYGPSRFVGGDDPHGVQAVDAAFDCHPDGELEKEPAPGDRVFDVEDERQAVVVDRPDRDHAQIESKLDRTLFERGYIDDEPEPATRANDQLRVIEDADEQGGAPP